jgi:hypothetical protein
MLALALACAAAGGCSRGPSTNLLLSVSDTLRADALACYGGSARTPHLCGLAERGALFERAYSAAPWTAPSAVALFTGSHPRGYADRALEQREQTYHVPDEERLLADVLGERGYTARFDLDNGLAYYSNALQGFEGLDVKSPEALAAVPPGRGDDERFARMGASLHFLATAREPSSPCAGSSIPRSLQARRSPRRPRAPRGRAAPRSAFYAGLGTTTRSTGCARCALALRRREAPPRRSTTRRSPSSTGASTALRRLDRRALGTLVNLHLGPRRGVRRARLWLHGKSLYEPLLAVPSSPPGVPAGLRIGAPSPHRLCRPLCEARGALRRRTPQGTSFALLAAGADRSPARGDSPERRTTPATGSTLIVGPWKLWRSPTGAPLSTISPPIPAAADLAASRPAEARGSRRLAAIRAENEARRARPRRPQRGPAPASARGDRRGLRGARLRG